MQEIENVCVMFQYATPSNIDSIQLELLKHFSTTVATRTELHQQLDKCLQLLHYSKREIVHTIVQNHLRYLLCKKHSLFKTEDLVSLFGSLKQNAPLNTASSLSGYLQIIGLITALCWLDSIDIENAYKDQLNELNNGRDYELGLQALYYVVTEMNQQTSELKGFTRHRRAGIAFRDEQLLPLLKTSFRIFTEALEQVGSPSQTVPVIVEFSLKIINACFNYDFLGYQQDQENHGMTNTIQVPPTWKEFILESSPLETMVRTFQILPESLYNQILEILSMVLGVKRSLFSETERGLYFDRCINNLMILLEYQFKPDCYSDFLKGILRFATVYSSDFKHSSLSSSFLHMFAQCTLARMNEMQVLDFLYLVLIWVQFRESDHSYFLDNMEEFQRLVTSFVTIDAEMLECLYTDEITTLEQIQNPLGKLVRKTLSVSSKLIIDRILRYGPGTSQKDYIETAWTIFVFSGALSHRVAYQASDEDDKNDGMVSAQILQSILYKKFQHITDVCDEKLELAILSFFEQFKYTYLSSESSSSKLWENLSAISIDNSEKFIIVMLNRVLYFLNHSTNENIVCRAAEVFHEYVTGVYCCKILQQQEILDHIEASGVFQIDIQCSYPKSKIIMKVFESIGRYSMVTRLFFTYQFNENPEKMLNKLLKSSCDYLQSFSTTGVHEGKMDFCIRRLRGILAAVYTNKLFKHYFLALSPYLRAISLYISSPGTPNGPYNGLRFMKELSTNKVNRLNFDAHAEYGILLFRESVAFCECQMGQLEPLLRSPNLTEKDRFQLCIKPTYIILDTFKGLICSKAVPFGILELYNEASLQELIKMAFFLSSAIQFEHISQYSKVSLAYFSFWTAITGDSMQYLLSSITPEIFDDLLTNCFQAIETMDDSSASNACAIINKIFSDAIENGGKFFAINPDLHHQKFVQLIMSRIYTDSLESQWSFTRPMLPLIFYQGEWFVGYMNLIMSLNENEKVREIMNGLLVGVDSTLSIKNRDTLTRNIDATKRSLESNGLRIVFPK